MDRVLLIIDDILYSQHVEMTLRKVGFDVESINNEFNVTESILSYNPSYIICRGSSSRVSTLNVGKKIKDSHSKHAGKIILIFPEDFQMTPDSLLEIKMDLLLFEPLSTLKLAVHLFSFSKNNFEFIRDKLLKFAITDSLFRNYEQQILKRVGVTLDSEINLVSSMEQPPPLESENVAQMNTTSTPVQVTEPTELSAQAAQKDVTSKLNKEIYVAEQELSLKMNAYDQVIKTVDIDLNVGFKKRQIKEVVSLQRKELMHKQSLDKKVEQAQQELDNEKIRFAQAMFKSKNKIDEIK